MSNVGSRAPSSVFARPLDVDTVPETGLDMTVEADEAERAAVASEVGIPAIGSLSANYRIGRRALGRLRVQGDVKARVTQVCTVTLEPFESGFDEPIDVTFAPSAAPRPDTRGSRATARGRSRRVAVSEAQAKAQAPPSSSEEEEDPPDPIVDGRIDLGALAVEFLVLALDFYPRKPGVLFTDVIQGDTGEPGPSAFAALKRIKDRS